MLWRKGGDRVTKKSRRHSGGKAGAAGRTLRTSKSKTQRSRAAKVLKKHQDQKH